jgi:hypothetical protein
MQEAVRKVAKAAKLEKTDHALVAKSKELWPVPVIGWRSSKQSDSATVGRIGGRANRWHEFVVTCRFKWQNG